MLLTRRQIVATAAVGAGADLPPETGAQALLDRYIGFGVKRSGGPGDLAAGAWLEGLLRGLGFTTDRQTFDAPFFETEVAELAVGTLRAAVTPQPLVAVTPPAGLTGRLAVREPWSTPEDLRGALAIVPLPFARWSTVNAEPVQTGVKKAVESGAAAVILVTTGPTGEAIMLNADAIRPMTNRPVVVLAPKDAPAFLQAAAAGREGRLLVSGRGGRRPTFNLMGRLDRGNDRWLVVSTPRSGWGICAGERGPGVAVWAMLARWAAETLPVNLLFLCNSGHEYENLGAEHAVREIAPPPEKTALWIHLGASVAARDWREHPLGLTPLPNADPQRVMAATATLEAACQTAFRGQVGLEAVSMVDASGAPGELGPILKAGFMRVAGVYGAHRFHHTMADNSRCVSSKLTTEAFAGFRTLTSNLLAHG